METRGVVDFNEPRLELSVKENVKAKDLEACTATVVTGEAGTVVMLEDWVD